MIGIRFLLALFFFVSSFYVATTIPLSNYGVVEVLQKDDVAQVLTVRFLGDVMLGRYVETLTNRHGTEYLLSKWHGFDDVDFTVINFESSMALPHRQTPNFTFQFATNPLHLSSLDRLNVTHASLANNHALDYGVAGFEYAQETLAASGILPFGHPRDISTSTSLAIVAQHDKRIAIMGLHTLFGQPRADDLQQVFSYAESVSDWQIVYIHWGDEYRLNANQPQRTLARQLVQLGADVIIGHHPHVVQDIDVIDGVPVFYSLGNFIFDQYFEQNVMDGLVLDVEVGDDIFIYLHPVTSRDSQSQPRRMTPEEENIFLSALAERSNPILHRMINEKMIVTTSLAIAP